MAEKMLIWAAFHYDVAYRVTFEEYLPVSFRAIDAGLMLLEESADFTFCIEQVVLLDAYWERRPEQRERLRKFAAEKRLIFCPGMWTMPDGSMPSAESAYQNARLGRQWLKEHLDAEPGPVCWMADIFGHHAQSPQIYSQLGYRLYMFERGQPAGVDAIDYRWEGIDGTSLVAHWEKDTYYGLNLALSWLGNRPESWIEERLEREVIAPLDRDGVILSKIGGDFLVVEHKHVDFVRRWNQSGRKPEIQFAVPDRYIAGLATRPDLPTVKTDMNPLLQGTLSTRIRLKQYNRKLENLVFAAEALDALAGRRPGRETAELWRTIAHQQFHDILCGSLSDKPWREALKTYEKASARSDKSVRKRLGAGRGGDTVLFNPLPYGRTEIVALPDGPRAVKLEPFETVSAAGACPADGLIPVRMDGHALDNGLIRAELDEFGRVSRLTDLVSGNVYEDTRFGYVHDLMLEPDFGDPWVLYRGPVNCSLLRVAPLRDPAHITGITTTRDGLYEQRGADSQCFDYPVLERSVAENGVTASLIVRQETNYSVRYTLNAGEKLLRVRVEHRWGSIRRRLRAVMPTGISGGTIRREIPAGWIVQEEGEYPAQNWLDYADETRGMCLLNKGLPGNNVTEGVMLLSLFRSVVLDEPGIVPDYETGVTQEAEYALCPFAPADPSYNPTRLGRLFNQPVLLAANAAVPSLKGIGFRLETPGAEIMALRPTSRRRTVEVRLYDASGKGCTAELAASRTIRKAEKVTPFGAPLEPLSVGNDNVARITLRPFEIATIEIAG